MERGEGLLVGRWSQSCRRKRGAQSHRRVRPLRHACCLCWQSCSLSLSGKKPAAAPVPPLVRRWVRGGRWASKLSSGGSFLARQSFASATPFVMKSSGRRVLLCRCASTASLVTLRRGAHSSAYGGWISGCPPPPALRKVPWARCSAPH